MLAFEEYNADTAQYFFAGFSNFEKAFAEFFGESTVLRTAFVNSLLLSLVTVVVGITLGLLFSYSIYKKCFGHKFFKVMLFMPSILSSIVVALMFTYFVERAIPDVVFTLFGKKIEGLLSNPDSTIPVLIFYSIWTSFGTSMLLYVGAMNNIDESIIEAGKLDDTNGLTEFIHIVFPSIYPTFIVFLTTTLVGIFTNQMNLYSFYGGSAEYRLYTVGYYLYRNTKLATLAEYPVLSAKGLMLTIIAVPLVLSIKSLLEKIGPSED